MKERLLDLICCKGCDGRFSVQATEKNGAEIISGKIGCMKCSTSYPIIRGIPRFIPGVKDETSLREVYADSFGHQWTTYNWLRDEDELEFFNITDFKKSDLEGKVLLDAGCGGGRFLRFLSGYCKEVVGLDYSVAVEKAQALTKDKDNVHLIQCDVHQHPFKANVFDIVMSHGVLHHTPDTLGGFKKLVPTLKPDGLMYIAVFRKAFFLLRWSDSFWRSIINKLPIPVIDKICGAMSYLCYLPKAVFLKRFFWFSLQATHEIRKCCLYDWYAPRYHHEHSVEEVMGWFADAGFDQIKYINAWPYAPEKEKYAIPTWMDSFRLGLLLGVRGHKKVLETSGKPVASQLAASAK